MRDGLFKGRLNDLPSERGTDRYLSNRNLRSRKQEVELYLIVPMKKPDAIVRAFSYNLHQGFTDQLLDSIRYAQNDLARNNNLGSQRDRTYLKPTHYTDEAIMPALHGHRFGRNYLNDCYRFILVVKNAQTNTRSRLVAPMRNQVVYTGWCLDEPISRMGSLNIDAELMFTNITQVEVKEKVGIDGFEDIASTRFNCDVLDPHISDIDSNSESDRDYLLGPDHILDAITDAENAEEDLYHSVTNKTVCQLGELPQAKTHMSIFNSPHQQLNRIVTGLTKTILEKSTGDDYRGRYSDEGSNFLGYKDSFLNRRQFRTNLEGGLNSRITGPEYYKKIQISKLVYLYPNLEDVTQVLDIDTPQYNSTDEERGDLFSVMCAYIKNSVPAILADHGISYISFRYASSDPRQLFISMKDREPIIDVEAVDPFLEENRNHTLNRTKCAIDQIRAHVLNVVERICGDIELLLVCKVGDDSLVQLQLRDHTDVINDQYALFQGELGGIISPVLGSSDEFDAGNSMITSLLDAIEEDSNFRERGFSPRDDYERDARY